MIKINNLRNTMVTLPLVALLYLPFYAKASEDSISFSIMPVEQNVEVGTFSESVSSIVSNAKGELNSIMARTLDERIERRDDKYVPIHINDIYNLDGGANILRFTKNWILVPHDLANNIDNEYPNSITSFNGLESKLDMKLSCEFPDNGFTLLYVAGLPNKTNYDEIIFDSNTDLSKLNNVGVYSNNGIFQHGVKVSDLNQYMSSVWGNPIITNNSGEIVAMNLGGKFVYGNELNNAFVNCSSKLK